MNKTKKGLLSRIKILMQRNRLGELMVVTGVLTSGELRYALNRQRETGEHLGHLLIRERMVSRQTLYRALFQQWSIRCLTGAMTVFLAFSALGAKPARAGTIRDVPAEMSLVHQANVAFTPVNAYPSLFGSTERRSDNISAFTKWSGMFDRYEDALHNPRDQRIITSWQNQLRPLVGLPLEEMAAAVNDFVNRQNYVEDNVNWGVSDYWETPVEFFQHGGDCEDFAIAKYASLRALGVPEDRLRVAIVFDKEKNLPHAVLIVYSDRGALLLDQQIKDVRFADNVGRYRPIFTINRYAWWLHTAPATTVLASAR